jgi:hypothetical protein
MRLRQETDWPLACRIHVSVSEAESSAHSQISEAVSSDIAPAKSLLAFLPK